MLHLSAEIDKKSAALKCAALERMSASLIGSDTDNFLTLMENVFGTYPEGETGSMAAMYEDPISKDQEASVLASQPSDPDKDTDAGEIAGPAPKRARLEGPTMTEDMRLDQCKVIFPDGKGSHHDTGVPPEHRPRRGGSGLYYCTFSGCVENRDQRGSLLSHVRRDHLGVALGCPYCQWKRFSGRAWMSHVTVQHPGLPLFPAQSELVYQPTPHTLESLSKEEAEEVVAAIAADSAAKGYTAGPVGGAVRGTPEPPTSSIASATVGGSVHGEQEPPVKTEAKECIETSD